MASNSNEGVVRVEAYTTSDGKEFSIARKPRPGRQCQTPQKTGERLGCPYCSEIHDVISYTVNKDRKGERQYKSWECPVAGKMPLNRSKKFQEYIAGITIRSDAKSVHDLKPKGQKKVRTKPDRPTGEMSPLYEYGKKKGVFRPETLGEYLKDHPVEEIIRRRQHPGRRGR